MAYQIGYVDDQGSEGRAHWQMLRLIRDFAGGYGTFTVPTFSGTGDGMLTDIDTDPDAVTETWTIQCTAATTPGAEIWSVTGSVSGAQADATTGVAYTSSLLSFAINTGATAFAVGDTFTLDVTAGALDASNRWTVERYLTPDGDADKRELILRGQGLSGTEEIYVGLRTYQSETADYYNMSVAGFTGYVSSNDFAHQPGYIESGIPAHNQHIDFWLAVNGQRIALAMKVGTPVYESAYVGKFLPYATPQQYPYPLVVAGMLDGIPGTRYSDTTHSMPYQGARNNMRMRFIDGAMRKPNVYPWSTGYATNNMTKTYQVRDTGGSYVLIPATMMDTSNVYGALDGIYQISGFNNVVENTIDLDGKTYIVVQDVFRTGFADYYALELN